MQPAALDAMIERARHYLHSRCSSDGLWRDFKTLAGDAVDWPSGYILDALCQVGADQRFLQKCAIALVSRQHADGGWGYHYGVPTDADSTATVLLFLNRLEIFPDIAERAAQCLLRFQNEAGGFATYQHDVEIRRYLRVGLQVDFRGWCQPCCEVTARAGRALLANPRYESVIAGAWTFLRSRQTVDGFWEPYWWSSAFFTTAEAAALAATLGDEEAVGGAVDWIVEQNDRYVATSTEYSAFVAALSLQILLLQDGEGKEHSGIVDLLTERIAAQQNADGGWRGTADLRIPPPHVTVPGDYGPWHVSGLGTGVTTRDHRGLFTTATALSALASVRDARYGHSRVRPWV
jgi:squalene cyclase